MSKLPSDLVDAVVWFKSKFVIREFWQTENFLFFWKFFVSMFNVTQKSDLDFEPMKCTLQLASHLFNFRIILRDPVKECAVYISVFVYK